MLGGILVLNTTFASSAPAGAIGPISKTFGLSEIVGTLMISLFVMGYMFGPLLWGPVGLYGNQNHHISDCRCSFLRPTADVRFS